MDALKPEAVAVLPQPVSPRRFVPVLRHLGGFIIGFAHGSLLLAGILVAGLAANRYAEHGLPGLNPHSLFQSQEELALADDEETSASQDTSGALSTEYQRLVQYISKRHKVSAAALEQVVRTAIHEGRVARVDPVLILAVTSIESGFNPMAESTFGAQGLMQIIPKFHQDKIDASLGPTPLLEPAENIRVGTRILREYIRTNGALETALQQYGGVSDAADTTYATKVMRELERFRQIMKYGSVRAEVADNSPAPVAVPAVHIETETPANPG